MKNSVEKYGQKTLGQFRKIPASKNRYQSVRNHAHQIIKYLKIKPTKCKMCDYTNHLDLCHIKDIASFSDDTKLSVINAVENLVFLCPNHHWDLGHGKINPEELNSGALDGI